MDSSHGGNGVSNRPEGPAPRLLCVYGSPRVRGNTDRLLDAFVRGAEDAGAAVERVYLRNLRISPCREIYACRDRGECALRDDMTPLYESLRTAEGIVLASPVMFYAVSGHAKAFIDRCQAFWSIKHQRHEPVNRSRVPRRRAVLLSVGASRGKRLFEGILLTFRYFCDAVEAEPAGALTYRGIDEAGEIDRHPTALADARRAGEEFARDLGAAIPFPGG